MTDRPKLRAALEQWKSALDAANGYLADECDFGAMDQHPAYVVWKQTIEAVENVESWLALLRAEQSPAEQKWRCKECRAMGVWHCQHPDECDGMKLVPAEPSPEPVSGPTLDECIATVREMAENSQRWADHFRVSGSVESEYSKLVYSAVVRALEAMRPSPEGAPS